VKHENFQVEGDVVKQDERYVVIDNKALNNLVLSSTLLHPGKSTSGHRHAGQEEVYFFTMGVGTMQLDDETFAVKAGDIIQIKDNVFHRVFNDSNDELYFVCVFDGRRNH
jgi:quercetin dioxygenase-like cupin family protein